MKPFSGFGNSPMKKNLGIQGLSSSQKKNFFTKAKEKAKQQFKKHGAKSGHGRIVDGKIVADKVSKKPIGRLGGIARTLGVKQVLKRLGPIGMALTAYDIAKTAKKAIPGLKRKAKSGNVNTGRKI